MPSNHTENYQLSQWVKSDQVKMEDFNADNAKLDAALKAEADARTAGDAALQAALATKGNCQIWTTSYVGLGLFTEANPNQVTFPSRPLAALILGADGNLLVIPLASGNGAFINGNSHVSFTWSGNTVSWYGSYIDAQMNMKGVKYTVIAFYARG